MIGFIWGENPRGVDNIYLKSEFYHKGEGLTHLYLWYSTRLALNGHIGDHRWTRGLMWNLCNVPSACLAHPQTHFNKWYLQHQSSVWLAHPCPGIPGRPWLDQATWCTTLELAWYWTPPLLTVIPARSPACPWWESQRPGCRSCAGGGRGGSGRPWWLRRCPACRGWGCLQRDCPFHAGSQRCGKSSSSDGNSLGWVVWPQQRCTEERAEAGKWLSWAVETQHWVNTSAH